MMLHIMHVISLNPVKDIRYYKRRIQTDKKSCDCQNHARVIILSVKYHNSSNTHTNNLALSNYNM